MTVALRGFTWPSITSVPNAWVVYQDGDGAWQTAQGTDGGYQLTVKDPAGHYGVAVQCPGTTNISAVLTTVHEDPNVRLGCPAAKAPPTVNVTLESANWPSGTTKVLGETGDSTTYEFSSVGTTWPTTVSGGVEDFAAEAQGAVKGRWSKGIILHNETVATGGDPKIFDFNNSFASTTFHVNTVGVTADDNDNGFDLSLLTAHGSRLNLPTPTFAESATLDGPPSSALLPTDRLSVGVTLTKGENNRVDVAFVAAPQDLTFTPPPYLTSTSITTTTGTELLPTFHWAGGPAQPHALALFIQTSRTYYVLESQGRLGSATQVALPDLTSAPGFDSVMTMDPGTTVSGLVVVFTFSGPPSTLLGFASQDFSGFAVGQHLAYSTGAAN